MNEASRLTPWDLYTPGENNPSRSPGFLAAAFDHPAWNLHLEWARKLSFKAVALDFRSDGPNAEKVAGLFEENGFLVVEVRKSAPAGKRKWVGWSDDLEFAKSELVHSNCLEMVWTPSDADALERLKTVTLDDPTSLAKFSVFVGGFSPQECASRLDRKWSAPRWLDGWVSPPQSLFESGMEILDDRRKGENPRWSIVIPAHKHRKELSHTLHALSSLEARPETFEIIVLDDNEPSEFHPIEIAPASLPFLWVRVPRKRQRLLGDRQFRAGSVRNLGVRLSRGQQLVFLDADILVREDFLTKLDDHATEGSVLQPCRWNLKPETALASRKVSALSPRWDCTLSFRGAWEDMQYSDRKWEELKRPWQWISTFCLSMPRKLFCDVGGFRESFDRYGFEDTELGFRFVQMNAKLVRVPTEVFHQHHLSERSEYGGSSEGRRRLRARSFENFFRWVLDPEIYREMGPK